nr:uncharacterized protein LOC113393102 [Vanessa tameamea]
MKMLKSIQIDIAEQKRERKEMETNITSSINTMNINISEKFEKMEQYYKKLYEQVKNQENILDRMERYIRKKNLVFFGIEEGEKSYQELENKMLIFINGINVSCERNEIESVKRIGKKRGLARPLDFDHSDDDGHILYNDMIQWMEIVNKLIEDQGYKSRIEPRTPV